MSLSNDSIFGMKSLVIQFRTCGQKQKAPVFTGALRIELCEAAYFFFLPDFFFAFLAGFAAAWAFRLAWAAARRAVGTR